MSRAGALALIVALALAAAACTFTRCTTYLIDPHLFNPSAPSQPVNVPRCTTS